MILKLLSIAAAPILIYQGRKVRRESPRLPEAAGAREGRCGSGSLLSLLVIGDSAAAGGGAPHQDKALAGKLSGLLGKSFSVRWKLLAKSGYKITDLIRMIEKTPHDNYRAVVISIGVNDVTSGRGTDSWKRNLEKLTELVKSKFQPEIIIISAIPPMHLFPSLPQPLRWFMGERARRLNKVTRKFTLSDRRCRVAEVNIPFSSEYMASDGFHPSPLAFGIWAEHIAGMVQCALARN